MTDTRILSVHSALIISVIEELVSVLREYQWNFSSPLSLLGIDPVLLSVLSKTISTSPLKYFKEYLFVPEL
jgi:hypothetical protein